MLLKKQYVLHKKSHKNLQELLETNSNFEEDFKILKKNHQNAYKLKYRWTGRINQIRLFLNKEQYTITLIIKEGLLGFLLPVVFLVGAITFYFFLNNTQAAVVTLGIAGFWCLYVCFFFFHYCKKLQVLIASHLDVDSVSGD